jgi:hypothetical protein
MPHDWQKLSEMVGNKKIIVNKISCPEDDISIEGKFNLPPLATLPYDDQVFIAVFIKTHGSIKEMEQAFGISYPTVKARLNKICGKLGFISLKKVDNREETLSKLERGEISVDDAVRRLS